MSLRSASRRAGAPGSARPSRSTRRKRAWWKKPSVLLSLAFIAIILLTFQGFFLARRVMNQQALLQEAQAAAAPAIGCEADIRANFTGSIRDSRDWLFHGTDKNGILTRNSLLILKVKAQKRTQRSYAELEYARPVEGNFLTQTVLVDSMHRGDQARNSAFPYFLVVFSDGSRTMVRVDDSSDDSSQWQVQSLFMPANSQAWQNGATQQFSRKQPVKLRFVRDGAKVSVLAKAEDNSLTDLQELGAFTVSETASARVSLGADLYKTRDSAQDELTAKFRNLRIFCAQAVLGNSRADSE